MVPPLGVVSQKRSRHRSVGSGILVCAVRRRMIFGDSVIVTVFREGGQTVRALVMVRGRGRLR